MAHPSPAPVPRRIEYIDGLRGIAVGMVLLYHSAWIDVGNGSGANRIHGLPLLYDVLVQAGTHGVDLFLVLSGFCLSYPALLKRRGGATSWFELRRFFARRALRILPPYYAALALLVAIGLLSTWLHLPRPPCMGSGLQLGDVFADFFLVQNLTGGYATINGSFWSLALEWQWYLVFPLLLLLCVRSRLAVLACCLGAAILWHTGTHDLFQLWHGTVAGALPARLFEFGCGIGAAWTVVHRDQCSRWARLALFLFLLFPIATTLPPVAALTAALFGLPQPVYGACFASLLLLIHYSFRLQRLFTARPLVGLGVCSYSVYLIHQPALQAAHMYIPDPFHSWVSAHLVALVLAVAAGVAFYRLVERPALRISARRAHSRRTADPAPIQQYGSVPVAAQ